MSIKIVPLNTRVTTVIGEVEGMITGVCIREGYINYDISYFKNGEYTNCWLNRAEFLVKSSNSKKVGLVNYDKEENQLETTLIEI